MIIIPIVKEVIIVIMIMMVMIMIIIVWTKTCSGGQYVVWH